MQTALVWLGGGAACQCDTPLLKNPARSRLESQEVLWQGSAFVRLIALA